MHKNIFVYGPPGSGKTRNSARLAEHFDLPRIIELDGTDPGDWIIEGGHGALVLTSTPPPDDTRRSLSINTAVEMLKCRPGYPF